MDWKKFILAVVVCFVMLEGTGFLIHGVWLQPIYQQFQDSWREQAQMEQKMWIMWVSDLLFTIMFAYVYTRGMENKPWLGQGIRYGITIALLMTIPVTLGNYVVFRVPYTLALTWMAVGAAQLIVVGVIVAFFLKKAPSAT